MITFSIHTRKTGAVMCHVTASNYLGAKNIFKQHFGFHHFWYSYKNTKGQRIKIDEKAPGIESVESVLEEGQAYVNQ